MLSSRKNRYRRLQGTPRHRTYCCEALEPRRLLDADGVLWGSPPYLTISYAPDGTDVGGQPSALFSMLDAVSATTEWQNAIFRAFQTWGVETNADIGVVPDSGVPFGTNGLTLGDSRFGDIRVGAVPLAPNVFAVAVAHDNIVAGTWVGDVLFNSTLAPQTVDELFSIALHEAGHVFGMSESADPLSPLHSAGISSATNLTAGDIALLHDLHGMRAPDLNEGLQANDTFLTATELKRVSALGSGEGSAPSAIFGDISSDQDVDIFRLDALSDHVGTVTFQVRSQGISLLAPKLSVFDTDLQLLGRVQSTLAGGNVVAMQLPHAPGSEAFFLQVEGATGDAFGVGGYSLIATFDDVLLTDQATIDLVTGRDFRFVSQEDIEEFLEEGESPFFNDDEHDDDELFAATELETAAGFVENAHYDTLGSMGDGTDVDYYKFETPSEINAPMTLTVRSLQSGSDLPRVTVVDGTNAPIATEIVVNRAGEIVLQTADLPADTELFARVEIVDGLGQPATGNYRLTINFGTSLVSWTPLLSGTWHAGDSTTVASMLIRETQLATWRLGNLAESTNNATQLTAKVTGLGELPLTVLSATAGETRTSEGVLLQPGTYTIEVSGSGSAGSLANYQLSAALVSDPLGIDPDDPTNDPVVVCPGSFETCLPGDTNLDGLVDAANDGATLLSNLGQGPDKSWFDGDFTGDGMVTASGDGPYLLENLAADMAASPLPLGPTVDLTADRATDVVMRGLMFADGSEQAVSQQLWPRATVSSRFSELLESRRAEASRNQQVGKWAASLSKSLLIDIATAWGNARQDHDLRPSFNRARLLASPESLRSFREPFASWSRAFPSTP